MGDVENLSIGLGRGITEQGRGLAQMVAHPIDTAQGVYRAGKAIYQDPSLVKGLLSDVYQQASSGPMGFGEVLGENMSLRPKAPKGLLEMTTYHGSPHKFDQFDLKKVGTGEGLQAFGHGLYVSETPGVAKSYMVAGSPTRYKVTLPDGMTDGSGFALGGARVPKDYAMQDVLRRVEQQGVEGTKAWLAEARKLSPDLGQEFAQMESRLDDLLSRGGRVDPVGYLYTVDLPDEHIAKMLDWDAPLGSAPEAFKRMVSRYKRYKDPDVVAKTTIGEAYKELAGHLGGQNLASEKLSKAGIPGIKYLDGSSRGAKEGTRNFVIFDDGIAKILKRE
jgi:hypothetical protein